MRLYKVFSVWESLIFIFFILSTLFLLLFYLNSSSLNEKGIKALRNKDFHSAQKYFRKNIEKGSLDDRSYLNLGLSYDLLNQPLKALEIYKVVSSSKKRSPGMFFSYFNQAELYGRLGNLEKALQNYQKALSFGQKKKEIKTNIELLFKKQKPNSKPDSKNKNSNNKNRSENSNNSQSGEDKKEEQEKAIDGNRSEENNQSENSVENQLEKDKEDSRKIEAKGEDKKDNPAGGPSEENKGESLKAEPNRNQSDKGSQKKVLTEREQKAILEEAQRQENKVRSRFYQNKKLLEIKQERTGKT